MGIASLTVPGGQEFHFPQLSIIRSYFSWNFLCFCPHFGPPGGGESPTREGPGYALVYVKYNTLGNQLKRWWIKQESLLVGVGGAYTLLKTTAS